MSNHEHLESLPIVERYPAEVWRAVNYAAKAHETQIRKLSGNHYIEHPFGVLNIVRGVTSDLATQQAAVLHDTVEDTWVTHSDLSEAFNEDVAQIVWGVTKDDTIDGWRACNEAYLVRLAGEAPEGSVLVALADKIHNLTDMIESFETYGASMWQHFAAEPSDQLWWYRSVLAIGQQRCPNNPLVAQLEYLVNDFRTRVLGAAANLTLEP